MYPLDANIFVRDLDPSSDDHDDCHRLIALIGTRRVPLVLPVLVLAEVAGAISRTRNDPMRGRIAVDIIREIPQIALVPLDDALAQAAAEITADYRLRGADAVYVAVAC